MKSRHTILVTIDMRAVLCSSLFRLETLFTIGLKKAFFQRKTIDYKKNNF